MKTIEVVAAIIREGDRVLATQRGYGEFEGMWEFPGGKIEPGESPQSAVGREIAEELGVHVSVGELLHTVEWDYPAFHLSMQCFVCSMGKENLQLREHTDYRWLSAAALNSVDWLPADVDVLPHVAKLLK